MGSVQEYFGGEGKGLDGVQAEKAGRTVAKMFEMFDMPTRGVISLIASLHTEALNAVGVDHVHEWRNGDGIGMQHGKAVLMWRVAMLHDKDADAELHRLK